jgi:hypothetical protein
MTSTHVVYVEIERFLADTKPEVFCLTGKWGVGKTYTWKTLVRQARDTKSIGLKRYAYVSLFGQNSLADLKAVIFEESRGIDAIDRPVDISSLDNAAKSLGAHWRTMVNQVRGFVTSYVPEYASGR